MNQENDIDDPNVDFGSDIDMREFAIPIEPLPPLSEAPKEESVETQARTEDESAATIPGPLDEIKEQLNSLAKLFETKIKYDEHKNKIIDELHQALQEHRQGLLQKYVQRMFMDVLKVVDDIRKFSAHYKDKPYEAEVAEKLLNFLQTTASDLEDLFSWEGITAYSCEGDILDPARQRVINKVQTDDPQKDKTIAERLRRGYKWDEKIIRPEMVSIFVYQKQEIAEEEKPDGQTSPTS